MFVGVGTVVDDFAGLRFADAGKIEQLSFGCGIHIDKRMLAVVPGVADTLRGSISRVHGFVGDFVELVACFFDGRFGALGGFRDLVAGFLVAGPLVVGVEVAAGGTGEQCDGAREKAKAGCASECCTCEDLALRDSVTQWLCEKLLPLGKMTFTTALPFG